MKSNHEILVEHGLDQWECKWSSDNESPLRIKLWFRYKDIVVYIKPTAWRKNKCYYTVFKATEKLRSLSQDVNNPMDQTWNKEILHQGWNFEQACLVARDAIIQTLLSV